MTSPMSAAAGSIAGEMEVEAYRRLFPLPYYERHLIESVRPDARPLSRSRSTSLAFNAVSSSDASALVKIGDTTMLAAIKLEVMTPSPESPDQGAVVNDDGRVIAVSKGQEGESKLELVNKEKRKLSLNSIPFSLTCMLHKKYIFADPTAEEESVMDTVITVVLDSRGRLVSVHKAGGSVLAYDSALQECISLTKRRVEELQEILKDAISTMEID